MPKFNLGAEEFVPKFGEEEMNFQPEVQVGVKMAQSVNFCVFLCRVKNFVIKKSGFKTLYLTKYHQKAVLVLHFQI